MQSVATIAIENRTTESSVAHTQRAAFDPGVVCEPIVLFAFVRQLRA